MRARISSVVRPIRFGVLADTSVNENLMQSIQVNSYLWGGAYNPIVPCEPSVPRVWQLENSGTDWTPRSLVDSFIYGFDPDSLIVIPGAHTHGRDLSAYRQVGPEDVLRTHWDFSDAKYGITIFEIASAFIEDELRYTLRQPFQFVQPRLLGEEWKMLEAVLYGMLPADLETRLFNQVGQAIDIERPEIALEQCLENLAGNMMNVRRLTNYGLHNPARETSFYLLDASNQGHILDFLALQAQGFSLAPVPIQVIASDRFVASVQTFRTQQRKTIWVGGMVSEGDLRSFIVRSGFVNPWIHRRKFLTPIPGDRYCWARVADIQQSKLPVEEGQVTIQLAEPLKGQYDRFNDGLEFAHDVGFSWQDPRWLPTDVIPAGIGTVWSPSNPYYLSHGRISSSGITVFNHLNSEETLPLPDATTIIREFYRTESWEAAPSDEGLRLSQMLSLMGGIYAGWFVVATSAFEVLTSQEIIGNDGVISVKTWNARLRRAKVDQERVENLTSSLLNMRVLALGLQFKCGTCNRSPWYSLSDAQDTMECTFCRGTVTPPTGSQSQLASAWAYRLQPPLDRADLRSNLLGLFACAGFFTRVRSDPVTLSLGLNLSKNDVKTEIDLTILVAERGAPSGTEPRPVFVESKGLYREFSESDIIGFEKLLPDFPKAAFVFSILRDSLTAGERDLIRTFAAKQHGGRRNHSVIILTRPELIARTNFSDEHGRAVRVGLLEQVAEVTQTRHLLAKSGSSSS